jgi:Glycosyltransferase family 87
VLGHAANAFSAVLPVRRMTMQEAPRSAFPRSAGSLTAVDAAIARARQPASPWQVFWICSAALAVRLYIAATTHGTNDIDTWVRFANLTLQYGLLRVYEIDRWFNHPPLMGFYAAGALTVARALPADFVFVFKIVPILANTVTILLVHRIGKLSAVWLLLFALNPTDVLISAYHGNTDTVCVALCVASILFADRSRPWLSGLSLGAALNVKLVPVILIAPMLLSLPRKQMLRFAVALGLSVLPFVPVMLGPWQAFRQNALLYNSFPAPWGVGLLTSMLDGRLVGYSKDFSTFCLTVGKPLILGCSLLLGLTQMCFRLFTRAELCAIAFSCFLVFAPGFGVQYLLYPTAIFAIAPRSRGFRYIYLSGAFAIATYYGYWTGTSPAFSDFNHAYDLRMILTGFLTWLCLCQFIASAAKRVVRVTFAALLARTF